ncbi:Uncharacterised protein [Raoultella terrigena]|uniref:Uncharacterized protein n=1 Tax=Raoultella terrigena TaxID=577 RepID=A0A3P8KVV0_RAOTE|nr:Uncharacterised protein [Raoultella terrigena]
MTDTLPDNLGAFRPSLRHSDRTAFITPGRMARSGK